MRRTSSKNREDIYIDGQRVPVRFNGWVRGLLDAHGQGITKPTVTALCAFFGCEEGALLAALDDHCLAYEVARSWMIEFVVAHWLLGNK